MNIRDILTFYDYHYWATERILAASAQVSEDQFQATAVHGLESLHKTLVHALEAEYAWRILCQQGSLSNFSALQEEDFPNVDALTRRWHEEERIWRAYLARLTDDDLNGYIHYMADEGVKRERILWHCLVHVVNHGTQHRSEAAAILTGYGYSPGELDFSLFLNQRPHR